MVQAGTIGATGVLHIADQPDALSVSSSLCRLASAWHTGGSVFWGAVTRHVLTADCVEDDSMADKRSRSVSVPEGPGAAVMTRTSSRTKRPSMYRVLLLNDDYTPMEFVIQILERFFNKNKEDATRIMMHVHQTGVGECGVFTYEVAETKVTQVMDFSRKNQHPLQCVMEKK